MDEDKIALHIGRQIRRSRRLLRWSQGDVGRWVGVTFQQIQKYECGASRISAVCLWRMAEALEVPIGYFFEGIPRRESLVRATEPQAADGPPSRLIAPAD